MKNLITILILGLLLACSKKEAPIPTPKVVSDILALKQGIYASGQVDTCLVVFVKDSVTIDFKIANNDGYPQVYHFGFRYFKLLKSNIKQTASNYGTFNGALITSDSLGVNYSVNQYGSATINYGNVNPQRSYTFIFDQGSTYKPGFKLNPSSIAGINGK